MIAIVSEVKNSERHERWRSLGYVINHDVLALKQTNYHKVDWSLILSSNCQLVIFELGNKYQSTKEKIQGALRKKPVIIIDGRITHRLQTWDDSIVTITKRPSYNSPSTTTEFNIIDELFEESWEQQTRLAEAQLNQQLLRQLKQPDDSILKFARYFQIDIDWDSLVSKAQATTQILWYLEHDILPDYDTMVRGLSLPPEELPRCEKLLWDYIKKSFTSDSVDYIIDVGNAELMESYIHSARSGC